MLPQALALCYLVLMYAFAYCEHENAQTVSRMHTLHKIEQFLILRTCDQDMQDDNEMLIEVVRSFPCLWNMSLREYKDERIKENMWCTVAEKLGGISVDNIK